jgi:hypothetical protein
LFLVSETADQLRQRHQQWLELNASAFATKASADYKESGRGAYVLDGTTWPPTFNALEYWPIAQRYFLTLKNGDDIERMIGEYDPARQFVIVIWEPGGITLAYRVNISIQRPPKR